jgi:hypothetical protein
MYGKQKCPGRLQDVCVPTLDAYKTIHVLPSYSKMFGAWTPPHPGARGRDKSSVIGILPPDFPCRFPYGKGGFEVAGGGGGKGESSSSY